MSHQTISPNFFPRRRKPRPQTNNFSLVRQLREEGRSNPDFELMLHNLSLEEIIAAKLEITAQENFRGKFYGFPLLSSIPWLVEDVMIKFAFSKTTSWREASRFLGTNEFSLRKLVRKKYGKNFKVR